MSYIEQRRHARLPLTRRVKLRCSDTGRCYAGTTHDVASAGLCIELDPSYTHATISPGARIRITVDWTGHQGVIATNLMPHATIVRRALTTADDALRLGIRYDQPQYLAATA